jgi:maleylpyruvate isomerase
VLHYGAVGVPHSEIELVRQSTRRLLRSAEALTDTEVAQPCLLPGWSRAELLTHLARNADGFRRMAEGAARGESAEMYPGGRQGRAADIAAGRGASARMVLADLRHASDALMETWNALPEDVWARPGRMTSGTRAIAETVEIRRREVEVHHVDLGSDYTPVDWPVAFVGSTLDDAMESLPARGAPHRPNVHARYRVEATDHGRSWVVALDGHRVDVAPNDADDVDAVVSGWGCDLLAWLYGRNGAGGTVTVAGHDGAVLHLSSWFPYP